MSASIRAEIESNKGNIAITYELGTDKCELRIEVGSPDWYEWASLTPTQATQLITLLSKAIKEIEETK